MKQLLQMLQEPTVAATGRVETYLQKPEMGTLPVSCTVTKPTFNLTGVEDLIRFITLALKTGAGVNVHLDNFPVDSGSQFSNQRQSNIHFHVDDENPDHIKFEPILSKISYDVPSLIVSDSIKRDGQCWYGRLKHEDNVSIIDAVYQSYLAGIREDNFLLDLTSLRPEGTKNSKGMVASGPRSFANLFEAAYNFGKHRTLSNCLSFLSTFNQEIRRGGVYKNGALTTSLPMWHPLAQEYMQISPILHPWLH
ncbi:MAG: hypothetical protein AAFW67_12775, partial [Cyanobacteria bacterium J06638_38]